MVRDLVFITLLSIPVVCSAQMEDYIQPGLLKASATITPTDMLASTESNYYISGFAEYHLEKKLSFRGEAFFFVDGNAEDPFIDNGLRTYFGAFYHLNKSNFDYSIGAGPGLSVMTVSNVQVSSTGDINPNPRTTFAIPTFVLQTGVSYYVWKYFHFFANVTYMRTPLTGVAVNSFSHPMNNLDELMFSAGLGFQIQTKRK